MCQESVNMDRAEFPKIDFHSAITVLFNVGEIFARSQNDALWEKSLDVYGSSGNALEATASSLILCYVFSTNSGIIGMFFTYCD